MVISLETRIENNLKIIACTNTNNCADCRADKNTCIKCQLSYYLVSGVCHACPQECPFCTNGSVCKKEESRLAAVLGAILGGVAAIILILVVIYKNDVVPKVKA